MNKNLQVHRNKCQLCYNQMGRLIMDCYCILCQTCFSKRNRQIDKCFICQNKTKHNFIDVKDSSGMTKMSHLFSNLETSLARCLEIYKFQASIDAKYCKFMENQLNKYKNAVNEIIQLNPQLQTYFNAKLSKKVSNIKSSSEYLPNHAPSYQQGQRYEQRAMNHVQPLHSSRSISNQSGLQHERMIQGQRVRVNAQDRHYSGMANYKPANINYNTALRSSHRVTKEQDANFYRR